jgi:L-ascorbate metabolism protein UlaG (beta-lactamase superfamily)
MKYQQIRNATAIIDYAGIRFLVDPMLSAKGAFPAFPGTPNEQLSNPTVELPIPMHEILNVDGVIVTHDHPDHWDERDQTGVQASGFMDVRWLGADTRFKGVMLIKTGGRHGSDEVMASPVGELLGEVCGVVFKHPDEKTAYLAGDTLWNELVQAALRQYKPEVIILNAGDARVVGFGSIIIEKGMSDRLLIPADGEICVL